MASRTRRRLERALLGWLMGMLALALDRRLRKRKKSGPPTA
jgi:hypothetical protein